MNFTKKNLVFLGAPGAGKGTIAKLMLAEHPFAHISTGDLLRAERANGTELGKQASALMDAGKLVPDELVGAMVKTRLAQPDCDNGFILDGYPRTLAQAELLNKILAELGKKLDAVVYLQVSDEVVLERLTSRLTCSKCGEIFNKLSMPPAVEGVCDKCKGALIQRPDDSLETAQNRLSVFHRTTQPLLDFYGQVAGLIITADKGDKDENMAILRRELA